MRAVVASITCGLCLGAALSDIVGQPVRVYGRSMEPTLLDGDWLWINKWRMLRRVGNRPMYGEVCTFVHPQRPEEGTFIKRIIGLPGDIIRSRSSYYATVGRGKCWVEGDNEARSDDSNRFRSIPLGLIVGVAVCIIWPPSRARPLPPFVPEGRLPVGRSRTQTYVDA